MAPSENEGIHEGVFRRGRETPLHLKCVVALSDRTMALKVAEKRLVGADEVMVTELSGAELRALRVKDGTDIFL